MKKVKFKDLIGNNDFLKMQELVVLQGGKQDKSNVCTTNRDNTERYCDGSVGMCVSGIAICETATINALPESKLVSQQAIYNIMLNANIW